MSLSTLSVILDPRPCPPRPHKEYLWSIIRWFVGLHFSTTFYCIIREVSTLFRLIKADSPNEDFELFEPMFSWYPRSHMTTLPLGEEIFKEN